MEQVIIVKIKGGLGNQLFQYATAKNLAGIINTDLYLDLSFYNEDRFKGVYRLDNFNLPYKLTDETDVSAFRTMNKCYFLYELLDKLKITRHYLKRNNWGENELSRFYDSNSTPKFESIKYLDGWFANPNFFSGIRSWLVKAIIPKRLSEKTLRLKEEINSFNSVAVHIRRGDYVNNPYFVNLTPEYFRKAISTIENKIHNPYFFFFSDDMDYVRNEFNDINNKKYLDFNNNKEGYYNTQRDVEDLYLISQCKHQIIANSTFSWWGAWLNNSPERLIVAPDKWYNDKKAQLNYKNGRFIPKNWIKI